MELQEWVERNQLSIVSNKQLAEGNLLTIGEQNFYLLPEQDKSYFDMEMEFALSDVQWQEIAEHKAYILFKFGKRWYYSPPKPSPSEFNDFKYIGKLKEEPMRLPHLGCHTEYELFRSVGRAEEYAKKARFVGVTEMAIIDRHTLGGVLEFQEMCRKYKVRAIIGMTVDVQYEGEFMFEVVLLVVNETGWRNLLKINNHIKALSIDEQMVTNEFLLNHSDGLAVILGRNSFIHSFRSRKANRSTIKQYEKHFEAVAYGIDTVEFAASNLDRQHLEYIRGYCENYHDILSPVVLNETYYVDAEHSRIKAKIAEISRKFGNNSNMQFLKSPQHQVALLREMFSEERQDIVDEAIESTCLLADLCQYQINTTEHKLPAYPVEPGVDKEEFFIDLLMEGFERKIKGKKRQVYEDRLAKEVDIIMRAGFVDYFLTLWDIIKYAREKNIYVGLGRGSAAGSLIAYLLDITDVDPIKYDLLFERFLNETRVSGELAKTPDAMPDIDVDFESRAREIIKDYIRERFGGVNVVTVGTYGRYKLKAAIQGLLKVKGRMGRYVTYLTTFIPTALHYYWKDIFVIALKGARDDGYRTEFFKFVQQHGDVVEDLKYVLNLPKTESQHASAVIIVPEVDKQGVQVNMHDWLPVRTDLKGNLTTEWEGTWVAKAGFLKEDVLSVNALDKLHDIVDWVEKNYGVKIDPRKIPVDDEKVFKMFHKGYNQDVFQFGSVGMKSYGVQLKPSNIEDLIAMIAIYRPGPMDVGSHEEYIKIKHGKKKVKYDWGCEPYTRDTYGQIIYQEQVIRVAHAVGGLSLAEADNMRKAIAKREKVKILPFRNMFVEGAVKNGCPPDQANALWEKVESFGRYGFNRSHAACYAIMGYNSMWMKVHYPLEFWTVALNHAGDKGESSIGNCLNEMRLMKLPIRVEGVDINDSDVNFTCDMEKSAIYWSLKRVKSCGEDAMTHVVNERNRNGHFKSLNDFLARLPRRIVNKVKITNLILSGAFDRIEGVRYPSDRKALLARFLSEHCDDVLPQVLASKPIGRDKDYLWIDLQKMRCGFGSIDFKALVPPAQRSKYEDPLQIIYAERLAYDAKVWVGGKIKDVFRKFTKKGEQFAKVTIENNDLNLVILVWPASYKVFGKDLEVDKLVLISGSPRFDQYHQMNVLHTHDASKLIVL